MKCLVIASLSFFTFVTNAMDVKKLDESKLETKKDSESLQKILIEKSVVHLLMKYKNVHTLHSGERVSLINQLERSGDYENTIEILNNLLVNKNTILHEFNHIHETLGFEDNLIKPNPIKEKYDPKEAPVEWFKRRTPKELAHIAEKLGITETVELPLK